MIHQILGSVVRIDLRNPELWGKSQFHDHLCNGIVCPLEHTIDNRVLLTIDFLNAFFKLGLQIFDLNIFGFLSMVFC